MKNLETFRRISLYLFALLNCIMLYLFLMLLPYGVQPLALSLKHWDKLSPQIGISWTIAIAVTLATVTLLRRLPEDWKNRLLYLRTHFSHPSADAFLNTRRRPFESGALLKAHPEVKDAGLKPASQVQTWQTIFAKHADVPVVRSTQVYWYMLRDLYLLSLVFLGVFLLAWIVRWGVPYEIVGNYVFLFGAQCLFLFLAARKVGWRFVDNVLATDLGITPK